jgi:hypothetical protein
MPPDERLTKSDEIFIRSNHPALAKNGGRLLLFLMAGHTNDRYDNRQSG